MIDRARVAEPGNAAIIDSHGWVLYRLGKPAEALSELRRAFTKQKDAEIAAHVAEVLWRLGQKDEAMKYFAVSYTHLDVYKRQVYGPHADALTFPPATFVVPPAFGIAGPAVGSGRGAGRGDPPGMRRRDRVREAGGGRARSADAGHGRRVRAAGRQAGRGRALVPLSLIHI